MGIQIGISGGATGRLRLAAKAVVVALFALMILVPLAMIDDVVQQRQSYRAQAVASIARSHAGPQAFVGPVLVVPYEETVETSTQDSQGVIRKVLRQRSGQWRWFPATLSLDGTLQPGTRKRGLYEVRVYEWQGHADARFDAVIPADPDPLHPRRIGAAWLDYGIADVRGLAGVPRLQVDGRAVVLQQGLRGREGSGVHASLAAPRAGERLQLDTRMAFALDGTESLALVPLGDRNQVTLASPWPHPQFGGSFLPRTRKVDARGFSASWDISSLATSAQARFDAGKTLPLVADRSGSGGDAVAVEGIDAIALSLVEPVNLYSQVDRATKYGFLFVLLTFAGFFLFELVRQLPIHPIQYALVGLALAIFFLLLLSLSEHMAFASAYLVASLACIGLLGFYLSAVLRSRLRGGAFAAMLALLYAALYGLLVSEDNALVLGALLLFAILAAAMVVTRKLDWYQLAERT